MHLIVFCCCIRPSFSPSRSFVHSHSMRQGGREKEIGSTRVATRSSCYFFILFYFIFYFPSWKTKESETCTMQIILGRRNGQTAKRPSSYSGRRLYLSACRHCVSVCGVCHKVLGNLDGRDVLVAPALLTTCRQCQRSQEWSGEKVKKKEQLFCG
jgi:hypothetical protein